MKTADAVIEFYNANAAAVPDPREMVAVGLALKLVNAPKDALRILTKAQRADKADHAATIELGRLLLLKGQVTDASNEFNTVLRAAPKHPDALIGLAACAFSLGKLEDAETHGKAALEAAPNAAAAHDLLAAMAFIDDDFDGMQAHADKSLAVNHSGIGARSLLAGCALARGNRAGYEREEALILKINPRCAAFYTTVGEVCSRKRRMTLAEQMFRKAIELDADAYDAMAALGQHLFRQAKYDEAKELLDASHRIDGFNVRTYNTLNLLDEMRKYEVFEAGPGLAVRLEKGQDGVLAEYVKEHALRSLDELCGTYRFRPAERVVIEVLPTQRYFATRCIGLPHIGAIGVCFGNVVAFTSPRIQGGHVNWRETLRHELTHAVTLLATDYRIPHWLTEGMAVHEQGSDRPYEWDVLLKTAARLGRLLPISQLTRAFTRPRTAEERMLAYCQSEVVVDFFVKKSGAKCLPELVAAFRGGKELPEAVQAVAGMPLAEFEKQCLAYVADAARSLPVLPKLTPQDEKYVIDEAAKKPDDADAQCTFALLLAAKQKPAEATAAADRAIRANARCAESHYIKAVIAQMQKRDADAAAAAQAALRADADYAPAHFLIAVAAEKEKKTTDAVRHLREAIRSHPTFPQPYVALAKLHKEMKQDDEAAAVLEQLIRRVPNPLAQCIELGRHYAAKKRWADAARVADVAIGIGPFFGEPHILAGQALWELGREDAAVREMEAGVICADASLKQMKAACEQLLAAGKKPQAAQLQKQIDEGCKLAAANGLRLARAYLKRGDAARAKLAALAAFDMDPNDDEIRELLRKLTK